MDVDAADANMHHYQTPQQQHEAQRLQNIEKMKFLKQWNHRLLIVLLHLMGYAAVTRSALATAETMSTMFTGLGAAEHACEFLRAGGTHPDINLPIKLVPILACDANELSQQLASARPPVAGVNPVVVGNMMEFFAVPFWRHDWRWQEKFAMLLNAPMNMHVLDIRTNRQVRVPSALVDFSGSPCVDHSTSNAHCRGGSAGRHNHLFLAWSVYHIRQGTAIIFHENVGGFDCDWAIAVLGAWYVLQVILVHPEHAGYNMVNRPRQVIVGVRKGVAQITRDMQAVYDVASSALATNLTISTMYIADAMEVMQEEIEESTARCIVPRFRGDLSYCLHATMRKYISRFDYQYWQGFCRLPHTDVDLIYNLQDNPSARLTWSATSRRLPTMRRDSRRLWIPSRARWLSFKERLSGMGFAAYIELANAAGVKQFPADFCRTKPHQMMLGDSMHVGAMGVVLGVALACIEIL